MEGIMNYVKPELIVVAVVLYFIGVALKTAETFADKFIPLVLGVVGIVIASVYVVGTSDMGSGKDVAMAIFTAITQGVLVAGLSTYVHQMIKQLGSEE